MHRTAALFQGILGDIKLNFGWVYFGVYHGFCIQRGTLVA